MLKIVAPTINFQVGDLKALPIIFPKQESIKQQIDTLTGECIDISKEEWDSRETSRDFTASPLLIEMQDIAERALVDKLVEIDAASGCVLLIKLKNVF